MEALADIAARVGSDVPAMLAGGPVLVQGRGDVIDPTTVDRLWWVLRSFDFGIRSPDAYRWWDEDRASSGPDTAQLLLAATKGDPETLGPLLFNDLERPVFARHPDLAEAKAALLEAGALGAVMSGSGSSVAGLARDQAHAGSLAKRWPSARVVAGPP
jgi:4-diphosphocytidyl-2-C-methyl-D-erythritol kinase